MFQSLKLAMMSMKMKIREKKIKNISQIVCEKFKFFNNKKKSFFMQKKQFFVSLMNRGCLFEYLSIRFFVYNFFTWKFL